MYVPSFYCSYCERFREAHVNGDQGVLTMCDCKESREAWEREHRAEMERRKRLRGNIKRLRKSKKRYK